MPDFLSGTYNELMAYETGAGSVRTVFGHGYQRLSQCTAEGKTFFQSDIYGSPLFAADGQGTVRQYAERGIWGGLKAGTEIPAGLEENLRFTSYRYDPVLGKHFAHARFYDDANGRMLALDPVRRDLNGYRYCDDDPVNYADPTGEVLNIIGGALLGGVFGGAGGLISSAVSQKLSGGEVDWKKAWGAAANGAITGAVQGGLVASGAGIPVALASNFLAGAAGSAAEQYISEGKVDARKSITSGLTNAVSNAIYGTKPLNSVKDAFLRGAGAGAATAGINYISDLIGQNPGWGGPDAGFLTGMAGKLVSPYGGAVRDPRRGCGSTSPFVTVPGYGSSKGYRYDVPRAGGAGRKQRKKFSLKEFLRETAAGGITGGVASAGFYGAGKGIERLKDSFRASKNQVAINNKQADFYITPNGEVVPSTGYRYSSRKVEVVQNARKGYMEARSDGLYFFFDKIDDAIIAQGKLQIPYRPEYRISFDTLDIIDDISIPKGRWGEANYLEPVTKDYRNFGPGGATQAITFSKINSIKEIYKLR